MNINSFTALNTMLTMGQQDITDLRQQAIAARSEVIATVADVNDKLDAINTSFNDTVKRMRQQLAESCGTAISNFDTQIKSLDTLIRTVEQIADPNYVPGQPKATTESNQ